MLGVRTESDRQEQLDWLRSRLDQGRRDHQRSREDLRMLEHEIREIEGELETVGHTSGSG